MIKNLSIQTLTILVTATSCLAQDVVEEKELQNDKRSGEIILEDTSVKKVSPRATALKETETWMNAIKTSVSTDGGATVTPATKPVLNYLATMYLYCLGKIGQCGFILDTVLEGDLLNNKGKEGVQCHHLPKFWQEWIEGEYEQRAKFLVSLANSAAIAQFNSTERPKYIKCKDTVSNIARSDTASRYGANGSSTKQVEKTLKLLNEIKAKNIDIFATIGIESESKVNKGTQKK